MDITNVNGGKTTAKGTTIVSASNSGTDKNSFLKILAAELSNQDPSNPADSTQYVAQMAQFTSLEQMANLNDTMTLNASNSLIGKGVTLNTLDTSGKQYTGIVRSVSKTGSNVYLNVEVNENGTNNLKQFAYSDVNNVIGVTDYDAQSQTDSLLLLATSSLIGKKAEFTQQDANGNDYEGTIKGVYKDGNSVQLTVQIDGQDKTMDISYDKLKKVLSE